MTFWGNIVYLRPLSVICGTSAKRKGRKCHYKGANKQYSRKKSFNYHYYQYTRPNNIQMQANTFNELYMFSNTSTSRWKFCAMLHCIGVVKKSCYVSDNKWIIIINELLFSNWTSAWNPCNASVNLARPEKHKMKWTDVLPRFVSRKTRRSCSLCIFALCLCFWIRIF